MLVFPLGYCDQADRNCNGKEKQEGKECFVVTAHSAAIILFTRKICFFFKHASLRTNDSRLENTFLFFMFLRASAFGRHIAILL